MPPAPVLPGSDLPSAKLEAFSEIVDHLSLLHATKRDLADCLLEGTGDGGRLSYDDMLALVRGRRKALDQECSVCLYASVLSRMALIAFRSNTTLRTLMVNIAVGLRG